MTMATKKEILKAQLGQYLAATKEGKGRILDGLKTTLGMPRKSIIRALRREQLHDQKATVRRPGRKTVYGLIVTEALKEIWTIAGEICAERLRPIIETYTHILIRDRMWNYSEAMTDLLLTMSLGTIKNRIRGFVHAKAGGGRSTTKPSHLKELIPVRTVPWENPVPGYGEIDTVVHCGHTLTGDMAYTVNYTDIATTWTESAAQLNKGQERTRESIAAIRKRLPFRLRGLDPDTGSEFINWHVKDWCDGEHIELTRSRPNHKNDNAHIEQKNYTTVRKFLGYVRIETEDAIRLMNGLYAGPLRLYINYFQPSMQCISKVRIGSRYVRKYGTPQTPYQRILNRGDIAPTIKEQLNHEYATLNPLKLRNEIDRLITRIIKIARPR